MTVTLQDLLTDPSFFFHQIDGNEAIFQPMARGDFERSIFLDGRIRHGGQQPLRVPLPHIVAAVDAAKLAIPRIGWIFHVAQCGSTLLARSLDLPARSLVLREPATIRQLGVLTGGQDDPQRPQGFGPLLRAVVTLLGKRWVSESCTVVKANVPVNFIAEEILDHDPEAAAILLHFPLEQYVASILRTDGHRRWTEGVFGELRLANSRWCEGAQPENLPEKAAALWFAEMKIFATLLEKFPNVRSLNAGAFFDDPASTVHAAADLFGLVMDEAEARRITEGELFHSYSKNPTLDYDPEVRAAREAEAMHRLADEIAVAREWARSARERHGLVEALHRPLVGPPAPLLR